MIFCAHTQEAEWLVDLNDPILPVLAASYMSVLAVITVYFLALSIYCGNKEDINPVIGTVRVIHDPKVCYVVLEEFCRYDITGCK